MTMWCTLRPGAAAHTPAHRRIAVATAVVALFAGQAAFADVTADDVWKSWSDYYGSLGQKIETESSGREGDTLVLKGVSMSATMPTGAYKASVGDVRMRDMGDGRVEVTFAPEMPITLNNKAQSGETVDMAMKVSQTGMTMIVSGTPQDMAYDLNAPDLRVGVDSMTVDGAAVPLTVNIALTGTTGSYKVTDGPIRSIVSDTKASGLTFDVAATDPKGTGQFSAKGNLVDIVGSSSAQIPQGIDMSNMAAALAAGFDAKGGFTIGSGNYNVDFKEAEKSMTANVESGGGNVNFALSQAGLVYGGGGKQAKIDIVSSDLPVPIDVSYAETAFNFAMPVSKGDTAQPVAMLVKIVDLSLSDTIWGLVDGGGKLPHDPATVILDVTGMAKLLVDIMDPAQAEAAAAPGEVEQVTLNQLLVKAVGAELTGKGAVNIDNSAGVPKPVGAVDLQLTGGNALIDKIVAMGLIPEDQAAGARMMLGLFAVPTGDDVLTSKIEFKEDGGIYANGQRLQ